ncbi:hypothetical protein [Sphingobium sp. YR768]|uniref:hypothetical protein n=1 Tax=Sphingobium sp. YR768 TaxID=1884365 RepID=UPI0008D2BFF6|nr:hypothetical protein [Sphingobium sp. YR768]SER51455.1 hypothetical protein SAMN05518866_112125 [Sphingobium sp. YR768]
MTDQDHSPFMFGTVPTTLFDAWLMPVTFWANWFSLCEEALHVAQKHPHPASATGEEAIPAHIENEEGLVA